MQKNISQIENLNTTKDIPSTPLRFLLYVSRPFMLFAILAVIAEIISASLNQSMPLLYRMIIDSAEIGNVTKVMWGAILIPVGLFGVLMFHRLSSFIARNWIIGSRQLSRNILSQHLLKHSHSYFADRPAGSLLNKINNVADSQEQLMFEILWTYFSVAFMFLTTTIILWSVGWQQGISFLSLLVILIIINIKLIPRKRELSKQFAETDSAFSGGVVDILSNSSAVRQFSAQKVEHGRVQKLTEDTKLKSLNSWNFTEITFIINNVLLAIFLGIISWISYKQWQEGNISTGDLILTVSIIMNIAFTIVWIGRAFSNWAKIFGRMEEGLKTIFMPIEIIDDPSATTLTVPYGKIEWEKVNFEYGENKVFNDFTLTIPAGQRLGLVGSSGAGKSTFVSLLLRQHDLQGGSISIDGQRIDEVTQDSLRANIAVVPQEPSLFHRTIRENIAYGKPDATDEEIIAVAKKAYAHDFIELLPQKYDTLVGERGVKLSGGQKQRIAIARAMLKDAPILILDEATSALDSESEVVIQKALHILMAGKTVIAIAHRLSTLREMDRIIVLENGSIIEDGTHDALLSYEGIYAKLWQHQAGGFVGEHL